MKVLCMVALLLTAIPVVGALDVDANVSLVTDVPVLPDIVVSVPSVPDINAVVVIGDVNQEFDVNKYIGVTSYPCVGIMGHTCVKRPEWSQEVDLTTCLANDVNIQNCLAGPEGIMTFERNKAIEDKAKAEAARDEALRNANPVLGAAVEGLKQSFIGAHNDALTEAQNNSDLFNTVLTALLLVIIVYVGAGWWSSRQNNMALPVTPLLPAPFGTRRMKSGVLELEPLAMAGELVQRGLPETDTSVPHLEQGSQSQSVGSVVNSAGPSPAPAAQPIKHEPEVPVDSLTEIKTRILATKEITTVGK